MDVWFGDGTINDVSAYFSFKEILSISKPVAVVETFLLLFPQDRIKTNKMMKDRNFKFIQSFQNVILIRNEKNEVLKNERI